MRRFGWTFALRDRKSVLGVGWSLVQPLMMTALLCVVFHKLFQIEIRDFAPYLLCGLACWNFLLNVTLQGCQCFYMAEPYIRQYPAPLAIFPLRITLGLMFHFLMTMIVVVGMSLILRGLSNPFALVSLIPGLTLWFLFGWSMAVLAGTANTYFRDTQHLAEVGFQILFYATPIMYPASVLRNNQLAVLLHINPLIPFIDLIRALIMDGRFPEPPTMLACVGLTALTVGLAGVVLRGCKSG